MGIATSFNRHDPVAPAAYNSLYQSGSAHPVGSGRITMWVEAARLENLLAQIDVEDCYIMSISPFLTHGPSSLPGERRLFHKIGR